MISNEESGGLYDRILQFATLPVLLVLLVLSVVVIQFLMSTKWQQARRNKQIRKAVAQRKREAEERAAESEPPAEANKKAPVTSPPEP